VSIPDNYEAIEKYQNAIAQIGASVPHGTSLKPSGFSQTSATLEEDHCDGGCGVHNYINGVGSNSETQNQYAQTDAELVTHTCKSN